MVKQLSSFKNGTLISSHLRLSDLKLPVCHKIDRFEAMRYQYGTIHSRFLTSACDRRQTRRLGLLSRITAEILYFTLFVREFLSLSTFLKTSDSAKNQRMRFNASFPKRNNSVFSWHGTGTCESNAKHHHSGHPEEENVVACLHQVQREKSTADKKDK